MQSQHGHAANYNKTASAKVLHYLLLISIVLALSGFAFAGALGTAVRTLPSSYTPLTTLTVTIDATPKTGTSTLGVYEHFPADWNFVDSNCLDANTGAACLAGDVSIVNVPGEIDWTIIGALGSLQEHERILTYRVTPPAGSSGLKTFSGSVDDYVGQVYSTFNITGASSISKFNNPPTVSIDSPKTILVFTAPATFDFNASASDIDGSVSKIELYTDKNANAIKTCVGVGATPCNTRLTNLAAGTYKLTARAYDDLNATTDANLIVTVNPGAVNYTLTINKTGSTGTGLVTGGSINCGATCTMTAVFGSFVLLHAAVDSNSTFTGWSGGICNGTVDCNVLVDSNKTVTALFTINPTVSVSQSVINAAEPSTNGKFTLTRSVPSASPLIVNFVVGGTATSNSDYFPIGTSATIPANSTSVDVPVNVIDDALVEGPETVVLTISNNSGVYLVGSPNSATVTIADNDVRFNARTIGNGSVACGGGSCPSTASAGSNITLTAIAGGDSNFTGWTLSPANAGTCPNNSITCTVTTNVDTNVTATFALKPTYILTVNKNGTGAGTIIGKIGTSQVINCGTDCNETVYASTNIDLNGVATVGSAFTGWSGGGCSGIGLCAVAVNASTTVTGSFADIQPPTMPTGLSANPISQSQINLTWNVSTDNIGVSVYKIYRCIDAACTPSIVLTTSASNSYNDTGLAANTTYNYTVDAYDAAGNSSGQSAAVPATTQAKPNVPPTVNITRPTSGQSFTTLDSIQIDANALDSDGTVTKVDFYADSTLIGTDNSAPFSYTWSGIAAKSYSITAIATDNNNATTTSGAVTITVNLPNYTLTILKDGNGSGTITGGLGINCGITCQGTASQGTIIALHAAADSNSTFTGWTIIGGGSCSGTGDCNVTLSNDKSATTTFVLKPVNQAPVVTLSPTSQTIALPSKARIIGSSSDDGLPAIPGKLTYAWSQISGPAGGATFSAPTQLDTNITFTTAGAYTLRLTASDSALTGTADASVTVQLPAVPIVQIISPANNSSAYVNTQVSIDTNTTSIATITQVAFYVDGNATPFKVIASPTQTHNITGWPGNSQLGNHTITVKSTDQYGQIGSASVTINVIALPPGPVVSITSPSPGDIFSINTPIEIDANAIPTSPLTINRVEFYADTNSTPFAVDTVVPYVAQYSTSVATTHTIKTIAYDSQGQSNFATISIVTINPALIGPTLAITFPTTTNGTLLTKTNYTFSADANAAGTKTITSVKFYINSTKAYATDMVKPYATTWSTKKAGKYTLTVVATDSNNLSATATFDFNVVNVRNPPTATFNTLVANDLPVTDLNTTDLTDMNSFGVGDTNTGMVYFSIAPPLDGNSIALDMSVDANTDLLANIDAGLTIYVDSNKKYGRVDVNTTILPMFDRNAQITLYMDAPNPKIKHNGTDCSANNCSIISNNASTGITFLANGFSTYEVFDTAPVCSNSVCEAGESCSNCPNDCGACVTPPGSGGPGGPSGPPAGPPAHTLSASIVAGFVSPLVEGTEAALSADTSGNYEKDDNVMLQANVFIGAQNVYSDSVLEKVSADANTLTLNLPGKWVPATPGDYNAVFTLLNADGNKKFSEKSILITVAGKQVGEGVTPGFAEQVGSAVVNALQLEYSGRTAPILILSLIILGVLLSFAIIRIHKK